MESLGIRDYFLIAITAWLVLLSFYFVKTAAKWRRLTGQGKQNFDEILEDILKKQHLSLEQLGEIKSEIAKIDTFQRSNFQKYTLLRFNPFEETGGDQSFVIALLDGKDNGLVISSLHARSGTRVYAKEVVGAKATTHQFSKEEKEAVEKACQAGRLAARHV